MGQVRHGRATTAHAIGATIQRSQATTAALSRELGINAKTVAKWRKRETLEDRKTSPTEPSSTVLSSSEEAMVVAFRRHTLVPLDDCLKPYSRRSHILRALHCIVACNVMGFPDYQIWKATNPNGKSSSATLLDISISTLPNCAQTKVSSISL